MSHSDLSPSGEESGPQGSGTDGDLESRSATPTDGEDLTGTGTDTDGYTEVINTDTDAYTEATDTEGMYSGATSDDEAGVQQYQEQLLRQHTQQVLTYADAAPGFSEDAATAHEYAYATRAATLFAAATARRQRAVAVTQGGSGFENTAAAIGGDRQWQRLVQQATSSSSVMSEARPVVDVLRRVLDSPTFRHSARNLDRQFSRAFLIQAVGQYVSAHSSRAELNTLLGSMKGHMDRLFARLLHLDSVSTQVFRLNVFPNAKQSRLFALQYALHKKLAAVATAVASGEAAPASSHMQPLFYLSVGSPLYSGAERFAWELMLPRNSFRIIPTKRVTTPTGVLPTPAAAGPAAGASSAAAASGPGDDDELTIPTYTMDLDVLRKQLQADIVAGFLPVALVATLGSDVAAASLAGGGSGLDEGAARYQLDDLEEMGHIADEFGLWMHVEGTAVLLGAASLDAKDSPSASRGAAAASKAASSSSASSAASSKSAASAASAVASPSPAAVARAIETSRSIFRLCDSVSSEVMGWFDLAGSSCIGFFKTDPTSTASDVPQPPGMAVSRDVIANLFTLWFSLVSHDVNFVENRVGHLLSVATHWRHRLLHRQSLPFPVLVGPTGPDADLFPHLLFFQLAPSSALQPLELFAMRDLNALNAYIHARLSSHVPEPFLAREDLPWLSAEDEAALQQQMQQAPTPRTLGDMLYDVADISPSGSGNASAASATPELAPIVETDADNDTSVPLSAWRRAGLLDCMDSSVSLATYGGGTSGQGARVGLLLHVLSSPASSSCLSSPAEARHVEWLLRAASEEMEWMRAAIGLREPFQRALQRHPELRYVPLEEVQPVEPTEKQRAAAGKSQAESAFATPLRPFCYGIGAFSYAPASMPLSAAQSDELNLALAESLARRNALYAPARSKAGRVIIVVQASPVVLRPNAVPLLLHELDHALRRQRLPPTVLQALAPAVQAGIRAAQERRLKDQTPLLFRPIELARKVPGVGAVLGWLRPEQHVQGVQRFQISGLASSNAQQTGQQQQQQSQQQSQH